MEAATAAEAMEATAAAANLICRALLFLSACSPPHCTDLRSSAWESEHTVRALMLLLLLLLMMMMIVDQKQPVTVCWAAKSSAAFACL